MTIGEYLEFVATKIREAEAKEDWLEVGRLLRQCSITASEKADEILGKSAS